jgi:hypothetical protein
MPDLDNQDIVEQRRALAIEPYKSLAIVGFDGPWVTPYQITSKSSGGPVLAAFHWLDESSILREWTTLQNLEIFPTFDSTPRSMRQSRVFACADRIFTSPKPSILYLGNALSGFTSRNQTLVRRGNSL